MNLQVQVFSGKILPPTQFNKYVDIKTSFNLKKSELVFVFLSNGHPWGPTRLPRIQTSSNNNNNNSNSSRSPFSPASDLRRLLRSTNQSPETPIREHSVKNSRGDDQAETDFNGPYNFRQLLRPTEHLPTESLRKRKGILMGERTNMPHTSVTPPNQPDDSPSKRRAKPVHPRKI
jgi:hypothetical protein